MPHQSLSTTAVQLATVARLIDLACTGHRTGYSSVYTLNDSRQTLSAPLNTTQRMTQVVLGKSRGLNNTNILYTHLPAASAQAAAAVVLHGTCTCSPGTLFIYPLQLVYMSYAMCTHGPPAPLPASTFLSVSAFYSCTTLVSTAITACSSGYIPTMEAW